MSAFANLLVVLRDAAQSEREKGGYFERLVKVYLTHEPYYADLYGGKVWLWEDWRREWMRSGHADPGADHGIDLVAETADGELHAIQAKFYAEDARLTMEDFATFLALSGKKHFARRLIFLTATKATYHLREAVREQSPPVTLISSFDMEASRVDWASTIPSNEVVQLRTTKTPRPYQESAIKDVLRGLQSADRGKLIMACGTGKTFTTLRLAERSAGAGGKVLFLVPSLNLLSQTLTEWTQEAEIPLHSYAVCSDSEVGKKRGGSEDDFELLAHELQYPATTSPRILSRAFASRHDNEHLHVIFSTYHSIDVIHQAQRDHGLPEFDLIVCDEAHRTTGATFDGQDESAFVKVHDNETIRGKKRVYMTATPRIYGGKAKKKAGDDESIVLYSMDDEAMYGKTLHTLTFSEAVRRKILCDYKVIVLTVSEDHISRSLQKLLAESTNSLNVNDAAKIVGCWRALSKMDSQDDLALDPEPMRRAVTFAQVIELQKGAKTHKISSKHIAAQFQAVVEAYRDELLAENPENPEAISRLACEAHHVDGNMGATEKNEALAWLKSEPPENTCRILSNVRCLSEGVDVPALDAVLFLTPRNSQVDVVQSVGRVMRKPPGGNKKLGYVILPVVIPSGVSPEEALDDNKTYRVVWEVLQALRSHDDRFEAMINRMRFDGQDKDRMEVIAITDELRKKTKSGSGDDKRKKKRDEARRRNVLGDAPKPEQHAIDFTFGEIERAILAKVVQKCGNRLYWDQWAGDIARIAGTHITRLTAILDESRNEAERAAFDAFLAGLRADINESVTRGEAVEMLAQHLITRPVFEALFEGYSFARNNPVSRAMQGVLAALERHHLEKEADTLTRMYESVHRRAADTKTVAGKQKLVVELYDKFFRNAFPKMAERLGIVYTPVEVVDFILHSIDDILRGEFGQTLASRNVHILDPFTGTGTFITRLMQSGLIPPEELPDKYRNEIHANEIVLLAYYIAAINIEAVYHSIVGGEYQAFTGICLTDTFNLPTGRNDDLDTQGRADNSKRLKRQRSLDIRVIMGNPPYSAGQGSANDNNQNLDYPSLDARIQETYVRSSQAVLRAKSYDSYIRAIRWASDRIRDRGVIGLVSNAGWLDSNSADGLRKCLAEEFSGIHVFHLRGNARTSGEQRRKEKDNVFGQGTRTPVAVYLLVKNPKAREQGKILFHDIGDYLTREEKLARIDEFRSIAGISAADGWTRIEPDAHHDWLRQRDSDFDAFIPLGHKGKNIATTIFNIYSLGIVTSRDAWAYNSSKSKLSENMKRCIDVYNEERLRYRVHGKSIKIDDFVTPNPALISWSVNLKADLSRNKSSEFEPASLVHSLYRPFSKQWMYSHRQWNERVLQMPRIFPNSAAKNRVISVTGRGATKEFSALMTDTLSDLEMISKGQCFPEYIYEKNPENTGKTLDICNDHGIISHSTAQHSTAQHSTAQHSTAQ
ncbi:MAG: DEAD/DEAH box helicase family protein, partial [Zoogloeaceae bacterium]|nr:DEAD/DEAH box helicase family protein [Zoogloeaceae bacterium]